MFIDTIPIGKDHYTPQEKIMDGSAETSKWHSENIHDKME
jgi:hypothetical protein